MSSPIEIIPVIHMIDERQVLISAGICYNCGIRKVFVIQHGFNQNKGLLEAAIKIKQKYTDMWVGVNFLGEDIKVLLNSPILNDVIDAIWSDDGLTRESIRHVVKAKYTRKYTGAFFGGLEFKYQRKSTNLKEDCSKSKYITDVSTTSGEATGSPASVYKITELREYLGNHPMAIASGVDLYNIQSYRGLVQYVLVASSITNPLSEIIVQGKLQALIDKNNEKI